MRNHLVHGYFAVDADLLWIAVTVEIPGLARTVRAWLND
ncbi:MULTISPECIES: HepT-like ribonuclease domain-containing protein [unclassified Frankia]